MGKQRVKHQQLPRPKRHEKKIFVRRRIWKPRKMKLTVLFLVFGFVVFAWCEKAKNVDVKTEEKKQDLKAKLTDLSKAAKRAKDYNGDHQKDWWSSTSWYTRRPRMTTWRPRMTTTDDHYYTSSSSCRGWGEYCNYSYQCCYIGVYCYNNRCQTPSSNPNHPTYATYPSTRRWVSKEEWLDEGEEDREDLVARERANEKSDEYSEQYGKKKN